MNETPTTERLTLIVYSFEWRKTQKENDFIVCQTSAGVCSCFDRDSIADIDAHIGKPLDVDFETMGKWRTIKKVHGLGTAISQAPPVVVPKVTSFVATGGGNTRDKSIRVQVALKAAIELCVHDKIALDQIKEFTCALVKIIDIAEKGEKEE